MRPRPSRRTALAAFASGLCAPTLWTRAAAASDLDDAMGELERTHRGRFGAAAVAIGSGRTASWRGDERFPLCSTFKVLAAGHILARVDRGTETLGRRVIFGRADLVTYSPVTEAHAGGDGMSLADICRAAITRSDNTAGNLMLASFGGPPELTAFARRLGDEVTRLDRTETSLNEGLPGDPRDTTSPAAMAADLRHLVVGDALSPGSREQLRAWLRANETGAARIRAAAPAGWDVGDKTGTGDLGSASDVAVLWPTPGGPPIVLAIYTAGLGGTLPDFNAAIAATARNMLRAVMPG